MSPSAHPSSAPSCYAGLDNGLINNVNHADIDCPLYECGGSCTKSSCREGLICFERSAKDGKKVPGCKGNAYRNNNYCIKAPSDVPSASPSMDPSSDPSVTPTSTPSDNPSSEPTCYGGSNTGQLEELHPNSSCPLEECAGDCDEDTDCVSGLKCFQRSMDDTRKVPDCKGSPMLDIDYCIKIPHFRH